MTQLPDFDPFELLGVDASADDATIDRAYKARIRFVHPDIAGVAGLDETKRLNVAREWLLDVELRAQLPKPSRRWRDRWRAAPPPPPPPEPPPSSTWPGSSGPAPGPEAAPKPPPAWARPRRPTRPAWDYDPLEDDPLTFDLGPRTEQLHAFFDVIRGLNRDERARVTHSLGDEPPFPFEGVKEFVSERVWARSRALEDAIARVWDERENESPPLLFPRGRVFGNGAVVANVYAQWMLLHEELRQRTRDADTIARVERRCVGPWEASVGHVRYGSHQDAVLAFLDEARDLTLNAAERLSRAWQRDMGSFLYGRPGEDWFPGTLDHAKPELVSARLAAVDASRIEPPPDMAWEQHNGYRFGLRLTAHVLALGGAEEPGRDYLRPWKEALDTNPSFLDRARWGMPHG